MTALPTCSRHATVEIGCPQCHRAACDEVVRRANLEPYDELLRRWNICYWRLEYEPNTRGEPEVQFSWVRKYRDGCTADIKDVRAGTIAECWQKAIEWEARNDIDEPEWAEPA